MRRLLAPKATTRPPAAASERMRTRAADAAFLTGRGLAAHVRVDADADVDVVWSPFGRFDAVAAADAAAVADVDSVAGDCWVASA